MDHACYMHEVPHYIILIRSSCFVNLKIELRDSEKASVLKVINLNAFGGGAYTCPIYM